jgi:putative spermidine/putrescine transport system ATP-binding protein
MGGHNVIHIDGKKFAIRTDRTRLESIAKLESGASTDRKNAYTATVTNVEFLGRSVEITVNLDNKELLASLSDEQYSSDALKVGKSVRVCWENQDIHEFTSG